LEGRVLENTSSLAVLGGIGLFSIAHLFALAHFPLWFGWRTAFLLFNGRVWVCQRLLLIAANRAPQQDHEHAHRVA
jgi:hypothetical protein